jgi:hypothetical protein
LDTGTQTIATFTGTLLRREHDLGQKFVQLVFREGDKNWLCISSKLSNAKLAIGQKYKIEGMFKQVGERTYIHEPKIELSKRHIPVKRLSIVAGAITALVTVGGVAFATHNGGTQPQPASHPAAQVVTTQPTSTAGTTEQTPPVATTTPAATPKSVTAITTTKTTAKKTTNAAAPPSTPATAPQTASTPADQVVPANPVDNTPPVQDPPADDSSSNTPPVDNTTSPDGDVPPTT